MGVLAGLQIGPANAAGQRLGQHLPRGRFGLGQRIDDDLTVPENGSAQSTSSLRYVIVLIPRRLPSVTRDALAGVGPGDIGELAFEGGGERETVQPFHLGGRRGRRAM